MIWHKTQVFKWSTLLWNSLTLISQSIHCLLGGRKWWWLFHGEPDLTISSRFYIESEMGNESARRIRQMLDGIFFFDPNHCEKSFDRDSSNSGRVKRIRGMIKGRKNGTR
jgi:hypothetical protein